MLTHDCSAWRVRRAGDNSLGDDLGKGACVAAQILIDANKKRARPARLDLGEDSSSEASDDDGEEGEDGGSGSGPDEGSDDADGDGAGDESSDDDEPETTTPAKGRKRSWWRPGLQGGKARVSGQRKQALGGGRGGSAPVFDY